MMFMIWIWLPRWHSCWWRYCEFQGHK